MKSKRTSPDIREEPGKVLCTGQGGYLFVVKYDESGSKGFTLGRSHKKELKFHRREFHYKKTFYKRGGGGKKRQREQTQPHRGGKGGSAPLFLPGKGDLSQTKKKNTRT